MSQIAISLRERIDAANAAVDLVAIIGRSVKLTGGKSPRGQCPFHGSRSLSLAVYSEKGFARCWGCGWHGDALKWLTDHDGLSFRDALAELEGRDSGSPRRASPAVRRHKQVREDSGDFVDSIDLGRHLWRRSSFDADAVRVYLRARGVPDEMLTERRLADIRFCSMGPVACWRQSRGPDSVAQAPAMLALVRAMPENGAPPGPDKDLDDWPALGVHATFLSPDLTSKMQRRARNGGKMEARKMLGPVGRGVLWLPGEDFGLPPRAGLFPGEGIETVLSGMAMLGAQPSDWGLAVLSLSNLQGALPRHKGAIPLFDPQPVEGAGPLAFAHDGPVTGLIDADMAPLRGMRDRQTGAFQGEAVIERKGGKPVHRAVSGRERADMCARLFVHGWRAAGCRQVRAVRPHMGQDFNDAIREAR